MRALADSACVCKGICTKTAIAHAAQGCRLHRVGPHLLPIDQLGIARRCVTSVSNDCSVTVSQELQDVRKYPNDIEVEAEHSKHILVHTKLEALVAVTYNALRVKD